MPTREAREGTGISVHGDGYEQLNAAIERASYTTTLYVPSTKQELKQAYQQEYGKSWLKHLSGDWVSIKYGNDLSEKERERLEHNEARKFNAKRMVDKNGNPSKFTGKNAAIGASLGRKHATEEKTPKDITGKRARVSWTGKLRTYDEKKMRPQRSYTGELSREEAREMRKGNFAPIFESFGFSPDAVEEITVDKIDVTFL